jgi:RNA polymerase sigma factor (sigma-70 family)
VTLPHEVFLLHLPLIERVVASTCRRYGVPPEEIEEFSAEFKLRLIQDDYAIIRHFEGRSSLGTFLTVVAARALIDHRIRQEGKWNASSTAKRLGDIAVDLERMLYRNHWTPDEAFPAISAKYPGTTRADVANLATALPPRLDRRYISIEDIGDVEAVRDPDVLAFEQADMAAQISATVSTFIDALPDKDQLILRLRFDAGLSVAQIARSVRLDQRLVYRSFYRWYNELRKKLEVAGFHKADIDAIVGSSTTVLDFHLNTRQTPERKSDD